MIRAVVATLVCAVASSAGPALAQAPPLEVPDPSQAASVSQRIGLTDLTVSFHRPAVRGRQVWGGLVPFGDVWRAGANENTVLTLSTPATVGGVPVAAGRYGVHMIPGEQEWTVILSHDADAWGSFFYDRSRDAARFAARPRAAAVQEHLSFAFEDPAEDSVTLTLRWERLALSIGIEVDTPVVVAGSLQRQLRGLPGFFWQSYAQAASWCARQNTHLDEALAWADRGVELQRNFTTLQAKALVLDRLGETATAKALREEALPLATEAQMNSYGYELLIAGELDEAIEVFRQNVAKHPGSWNVYDSLGEALAARGRTAEAVRQYEKALSMVPSDVHKARITAILSRLAGRE